MKIRWGRTLSAIAISTAVMLVTFAGLDLWADEMLTPYARLVLVVGSAAASCYAVHKRSGFANFFIEVGAVCGMLTIAAFLAIGHGAAMWQICLAFAAALVGNGVGHAIHWMAVYRTHIQLDRV